MTAPGASPLAAASIESGATTQPTPREVNRVALVYGVLGALGVLIALASLSTGAGSLSDPVLRPTLLELRTARLAAGVLVGAALAVSGVMVQGLFRNPLADASILGTSAGAALGGKLALLLAELVFATSVWGTLAPDVLLPLGSLFGALVALIVLLMFLRTGSDPLSVLLTGFILSSLFVSLGSLATSVAQERWELGRAIIAFSLGGLGGTSFRHVALALPLVAFGIVAAWFWAKPLDVLLSGEHEAMSLGVDVPLLRRFCILWIAVLTASAVALGGNIGFVGLIIPHALRPVLGAEHRRLLPAAAIGGALFVAGCDVLSRLIPARSEVPLGVITGLIGAPLFLVLLSRARRSEAYG